MSTPAAFPVVRRRAVPIRSRPRPTSSTVSSPRNPVKSVDPLGKATTYIYDDGAAAKDQAWRVCETDSLSRTVVAKCIQMKRRICATVTTLLCLAWLPALVCAVSDAAPGQPMPSSVRIVKGACAIYFIGFYLISLALLFWGSFRSSSIVLTLLAWMFFLVCNAFGPIVLVLCLQILLGGTDTGVCDHLQSLVGLKGKQGPR